MNINSTSVKQLNNWSKNFDERRYKRQAIVEDYSIPEFVYRNGRPFTEKRINAQ